MERNNKLVMIIAVALILVCLIFALTNKNDDVDNLTNNGENKVSVNYREISNEVTGETYYQVYNEETGEVIANVVEEHQVDLYIDNPDYVETEVVEDMNEQQELLEQ